MGNYKKLIFLFLVSVFGGNSLVMGQVKIGGDPSVINVNSALEIEASNKGLLLPRLALVSTTSVAPLTNSIVAGMTVYNTATNGDVTPGFYYYNGTKWIRVADATAGSITASNGLSGSGNDIQLGGALTLPTTITTDATNTFALAGLQTGLVTDDVMLSNGGVVKKINATSFLNGATTNSISNTNGSLETIVNGKSSGVVPVLISSSNGLTTTNGDAKLGGILTEPTTTITTSAANTLILAGLQPGVATDDVLISNSGVVKKIDGVSFLSGVTTNSISNTNGSLETIVNGKSSGVVPVLISSSNGLTTTNGDAKLGGILTEPTTTITTSAANTLTLAGLQTGVATDDVLISNSGVVKKIDGVSFLSGVTTNSISNTNGSLETIVNGKSSGVVPVLISSSNGLTTTDGDVKLGGTLTSSTTITQNTNALAFDGTAGTGGTTTFDNNVGSSIRVFAKEDTGRAGLTLATGVTASLDSSITGGGGAQITANGSNGFNIGTNNAFDLSFSTDNTQRLRIGSAGKVFLENNMVIYSTNGGANTSGLQLYELRNNSPETAGAGAIGVDGGGNVVRVMNASAVPTIYTANGALTGNRTITQGANSLRFDGTSGTGGYTTFNNDAGSTIGTYANAVNGRAALALGAGPTTMFSFVDGGSNAQIVAVGSAGLSIGTSDASGINFNTDNNQRMSISDIGMVAVSESLEINNTAGANDTSGLRISKLTSASPETAGAGAIGVDSNGDVVRVSTVTSPFSSKVALTITAATSPTKGAFQNDFIRYRDIGNNAIEVDFLYSSTGAGGAGSGDYLFTLPNAYNFDTSENDFYGGPITGLADLNAALPFALKDVKAVFVGSGATSTTAYVIPYSASQFRLISVSTGLPVGAASNGMGGATAVYSGRFIFVKQ
jgi:hypothetical protein